MAETNIELLAGLNLTTSEKQILSDIQTLQKRLEAAGISIKLTAELDKKLLDSMKDLGKREIASAGTDLGEQLAENLIRGYNIKGKEVQDEIRKLTKSIYSASVQEIQSGGEVDGFISTLDRLLVSVTENARMIKEKMGIYDEFYQYFKNLSGIKIPDIVPQDLGSDWDKLRKVYASKFTIQADGIELDSVYQEMADKFKNLFSGTADPTKQFREITDALRAYQQDVKEMIPLDTSSIEHAYADIVRSVGEMRVQIQNSLQEAGNLDHVLDTDKIEESVREVQREASAMEQVEDSARTAAKQKESFADANREVALTAGTTSDTVREEHNAFMDMDDIDSILAGINVQGQRGINVFETFGNTFRNAFAAYSLANLAADAIRNIGNAGRNAVKTVKDLNDSGVSLQMATGADSKEVKDMMQSYNALGQEIRVITTDVAASADAWLRQGHTIEDTNTLIRDSIILSKIANLDAADSTEYLTSAMKGYKLAAEDVIGIVDKVSQVDLVSATDAGGLMEAMSRTAVSADMAGVSMDKLLGYLATVGEVTQKSMSSVGESFKTIFSRMSDIKADKLKLIDEDGTEELLSDVELTLSKVGIDLRKTVTEYNNYGDVLDNLAKKWNTLNSTQQAALTKAFAGTRQGENFRVLMENYQSALNYERVAMDSAGKSAEKFDIYLNSLEAKTNSLKASLEALASNTISEELYASILDISKGMVDAADSSGILKGALAGIGTAGAIHTFQQLAGFMHNAAQEFSNLSEAMSISRAGNIGEDELQRLINLSNGLSQSQTKLLLSTRNLTDAQKVAILMNQGMSQAEAEAQLQTWGLASAQNGAAGATITLRGALQGLWATLIANPIVLVTAAVSAGVMAFNNYKQAEEEAHQQALDSAQAAGELSNEVSELVNQYLHLSEAVKTDQSAKEGLLSTQDNLLEKLGLEGENLDDLIEKYGSLSDAIKQASLDSLKDAQIDLIAGLSAAEEDLVKAGKDNLIGTKNILSSAGEEAVKAYQVLEKASLITKGAYGSGGGSFILSGDNSVDGILENYNKLDAALKALRDSDEFTAEQLSNNPVYQQLYNRWNEMKESVEGYQSAIDQLNQNAAQQTMLTSLQGTELPDTEESFQEFRNELVQTAIASEQFIGSEEEIAQAIDKCLKATPEFAQYYGIQMEDLADTAGQTAKKIEKSFNKEEMIATINGMSEGFEELDKLYNSVKDKNPFDYAILDDKAFKETFSGLGDAYTAFMEQIAKTPNDINACQSAFDGLLTAWLNSSGILSGLSDETADLTIAMLESRGVMNAEEIVTARLVALHAELAAEKEYNAITGRNLANATMEEISAFVSESAASDETKQVLAQLELAKIAVNNVRIDTASDIDQVINLANAAGASANALNQLARAKSVYGGSVSSGLKAGAAGALRQLEEAQATVKSVADGTFDFQFTPIDASKYKSAAYGGGAKSNKSSGGSKDKSSKDDTEKFDFIKQKMDELRESYSKLQSEANNSDNTYANQLNYLNAAISKQEELIELEKIALNVYKADWDQASSALPENLRNLIVNGSKDVETAIQNLSGTQKEQTEKAMESWNTYKELSDKINEDEKERGKNQESRYQKQIEWDKSEINKLKEKSSIERESYSDNLDFINQAVAKSEELSAKLKQKAEEAKKEWEEAKAVIESIGSSGDIAKIINGELDLSAFEDNPEYYAALERGVNAHEDLMDKEEDLEENELSLEELRKEAFEKGIAYLKSQQDLIKNTNGTTQSAIDLIEALGGEATADMYQDMIDNNQELIDLYEEQIDTLSDRISEVDEESAEYYELKGQIEEVNQSILACKKEQQEWNEAILDLPIRKLERYQAILKNIKQDLQNWINQQTTLTNPTTQPQYQSLIDISTKQIKSGLEEITRLQEKLNQYEWNSDKYNETAQQIQDIKDEIAGLIQNQTEWNEAIKQIPITNIERLQANQDNLMQSAQNWIAEQQAFGNKIDVDQYQQLFDLGSTQIATQLEKIDLLTKNLNTYDPNSEKYQETLQAIQEAKNEISSIVQDQIAWNEAIKQIPIDNIEQLQASYENVVQALDNWIAEQEALGNNIGAEQYQKQIDLAAARIESNQEKIALLNQKLATYEPNSEKYNETLQAIHDAENEISSLVQDQIAWNEAIKQIPIDNIEQLQNGYAGVRKELEAWITTQEALGYTTGEEQYQTLIDMASTQIAGNLKKIELLQEKLSTYEPNSEGYQETLQAIEDAKSEINSLVQDQVKWNEAIKQIPLNHIAKLQDGLSNLQSRLEDWINKQDALNQLIDADVYQKLIDLGSEQISSYREEIELLKKNLATYDPGTDQYNETLQAINEAENKISSIVQSQAEWNETLKQLPIDNVDRLQKGLSNLQSKLDAWISQQTAIGNIIGSKQYQALIDVSSVQIDALNERITILKKNLETYEPNSAKYDETLQSIQDAENEIASIVQSQIEWNEELKQIPIDRIDVLQNKYSNLRQDLQNWIDEQGALGNIIGRDQYQSLFDFSLVQIDAYTKKLDLLQEKLKTYEEGSDKYNETAQAIQDVKNEISAAIKEQAEWNAQILNMPLEKLNKYTEQLQFVLDSLQGVQDEMDIAISAVTETIERETDAINEQKEAIEDEKEATEDAYQAKIDAIQEIIDGLQDAREEEDLLLKIEKARAAWQKAQEQKTKKVLREGTWQWEADIEEINNAKKELDDAILDKQINDLEKEIEALEDERDALLEGMDDQLEMMDDQIEKLDKISEKWQQISKDAQYYADILKATEQLGEGWKDKVISGNDADIFEPFREQYLQNSAMMDQYQQQINSNERIAALMEQYINGWKEGAITYENAYENMGVLLEQMKDGFSAFENLDGTLDLNASLGNGGESLSDILSVLKDNSDSSANEFKEYLSQVQDNNEIIADFTKSWDEVQSSVLSQLEVLKQNYDIMAGVDYDSIQDNADAINQFTSSWNDIRDSIDDQIEALKQNYASMDQIDYDAIRENADAMNQFNESWAEIRESVSTQITELQKNYEALGNINYDALFTNADAISQFVATWKEMQASVTTQIGELQKNYETLEKVDYDVVKSNSEMIAKFTSTWKEIESSIDKQLASLQKNYEALEKVNYNTVNTNAKALDKIVSSWEEVQSSIQSQLKVLQKNYDALEKIDYSAIKANADAINKQTLSWEKMYASVQKQLEDLEKAFNQPQNIAVEVTSSIYRGDSDKDRDDKEPIGTTVTAIKVVHAGKLGDTSDNWTQYYHTGLEKGRVGNNLSDAELKRLQELSLTPLDYDEIDAVLQKGEVVLTEGQQHILDENVRKLYTLGSAGWNADVMQAIERQASHEAIAKVMNPGGSAGTVNKNASQNINVGGVQIYMNDVQDATAFAQHIKKYAEPMVAQIVGRDRIM